MYDSTMFIKISHIRPTKRMMGHILTNKIILIKTKTRSYGASYDCRNIENIAVINNTSYVLCSDNQY